MECFSIKLWKVLNHVIGTQEAVHVRRRSNLLSDKINNVVHANIRSLLSGSRSEGFVFKHSDIDVMFVRDDLSVARTTDYDNEHDSDIVMEIDNVKPGFVRLRCEDSIRYKEETVSALVEAKGGLYLSSVLYRDSFLSQYKVNTPDAFAHGPCVTFDTNFDTSDGLDLLHCIASKSWPPNMLSEWVERERKHNWPSHGLITEILADGCILVPIGNPNSEQYFLQWRISFSIAEKKLVHTFNHIQFLCYGLLKLYLKHVIKSIDEVKDLVCSYFLKTSLFYCIEEENVCWCKENLFDCFWTCFRRLISWVREEYCPNYFVKENNMFEGKICGENREILLRHLTELYHDGINRLRMIPCLADIFGDEKIYRVREFCSKEWYFDMELLHKVFSAYRPDKYKDCLVKMAFISKLLRQTTSHVDRMILTLFYDQKCCLIIQYLYYNITIRTTNKSHYKELKGLRRYISMINDRCIRMLLLATLCYLNGEYRDVVTIIEDVLRAHGRFLTLCYDVIRYQDEICLKNVTFQQKLKSGLFSGLHHVLLDCGFYPPEVAEDFQTCDRRSMLLALIRIPTALYANILMFLAHRHLGCREKMNFFLNELYIAVHGEYLYESDKKISKSLFETCLRVADQDMSACQI